jgi:two-component system, OmpR family, sensor histidine kinase CreC
VSQRNRVFLVVLLVYVLAVAFLLHRFVAEIDPRYRESAEDSLVETANLLASLVEQQMSDETIDVARLRPLFRELYSRQFEAQVYGVKKTRVDMRVYVTDARGWVLFDSAGRDEGRNFSLWRDVALTLDGRYGARTTTVIEGRPETAEMYVGAPIRFQEQIVGVVTVGRPVESFGRYRDSAQGRMIAIGVSSALAFALLLLLVSAWLAMPQGVITEFWRYAWSEPRIRPRRLFRRGRTLLRTAYGEIRAALAGREYVAEYVQALTHELKSPLSAIRGAAELLQEPMPEAERARFAANVARESQRIQTLIERLLELAALQRRRGLEQSEGLDVPALVDDAVEAARAEGRRHDVAIEVAAGPPARVDGDRLLLTAALVNLLDNAVDFSPEAGVVTVDWNTKAFTVEIRVVDRGTGIPEYARGRVFDRFYSLARPRNGKKGTGLGLPFVREVAGLHDGDVRLDSRTADEDGGPGTTATLVLPLAD